MQLGCAQGRAAEREQGVSERHHPGASRFYLCLRGVVPLSPVQGEDVTSVRRGGMGMAERARTLAALQPGCLSPHRGGHPERPALW